MDRRPAGRAPGRPAAVVRRPTLLRLLGAPEPGRSGTRVERRFAGARADRPRREDTQDRLVPANADGEVRRAGAASGLLAEEVLDDAVLERVERDHGDAATRPKHLDRSGQRVLEGVELLVHGDAERLEDALGRVTVAEPGGRGNRGFDRVDELAGALERLLATPSTDRARDLAGKTLFSVPAEDPLQVTLGRLVDQLPGG